MQRVEAIALKGVSSFLFIYIGFGIRATSSADLTFYWFLFGSMGERIGFIDYFI